MTKILFTGVGSAFADSKSWQTQMVIQSDSGKNLLIDCGSDARHSLAQYGLAARDIDGVYISHLHGDHVHGLEWLGFFRYPWKPSEIDNRPHLYIHEDLVAPLWNNVLSGTMAALNNKTATLDSYFNVHAVEESARMFSWSGMVFDLIRTHHVETDTHVTPSYGLTVAGKSGSVYISSDTDRLPSPQILDDVDIIVHDCETNPHAFASDVHTHFDDLLAMHPAHRRKTWLVHYQAQFASSQAARDAGFAGFVRPGDTVSF